ncbi:hypothetical protein [Rosenbergiella australiborealis]|uniref:Uncharacterized protein n=1 Tax=Rosenbergiella australiborealis TaxID=1544696 RepID=A0ABS5T6C3_9GAMM|nr:hypothetical protein [Rosenbergiella australiborealis]MBT0727899.1 hypothetical protein [Rosenbergiella australiborealis]
MNNKEYVRSIAIIDTCNFTKIAIESVCQQISNKILVLRFNSVQELIQHPQRSQVDLVFYDTLTTNSIIIDPELDIRKIRDNINGVKICIFSILHQFMSIKSADYEIDKRLSLEDFNFFTRILCQDDGERCKRNYSVVFYDRINLSKEQVSLLRGYLLNLNTKDIADILQCNLRKVYFYREGTLRKGKNRPSFYKDIGRLINP